MHKRRKEIITGAPERQISQHCMEQAVIHPGPTVYFSRHPEASRYYENFEYFSQFISFTESSDVTLLPGGKYFFPFGGDATPCLGSVRDLISYFDKKALQALLVFDGDYWGDMKSAEKTSLLWNLYFTRHDVILTLPDPASCDFLQAYQQYFLPYHPYINEKMLKDFFGGWRVIMLPASPKYTVHRNDGNIIYVDFNRN